MAEKLKIISLGGLNEIGKNLTVYEYGGDIIIVDVGMGFPDDDMYGIDVVIPDSVSYTHLAGKLSTGSFTPARWRPSTISTLPIPMTTRCAPTWWTV